MHHGFVDFERMEDAVTVENVHHITAGVVLNASAPVSSPLLKTNKEGNIYVAFVQPKGNRRMLLEQNYAMSLLTHKFVLKASIDSKLLQFKSLLSKLCTNASLVPPYASEGQMETLLESVTVGFMHEPLVAD